MSVTFRIDFKKKSKLKTDLASLQLDELFLQGDNGHAVILIHGLTGTPHEMKFLANFLHRQGYSVVCPRLANHGQPLEILKTTKWPDFYESVRQAFIKAKDSYDLIFVAGLSMGALLALLLVEEFPDRIAGVSCLSPTLFYDGWNTPWSKCLLPLAYMTPIKHYFYFKEDPPYGIKNETIRRFVHKYYSRASLNDIKEVARYGYPYFPVTLLYQLHLLVKTLTKKLGNIRAPVQIIQAKDDDMTSVKNAQFIYDRVKSEVKEIVLLYNSYHLITADQERDKVAEAMERFFNRIRNGPAFKSQETGEVLKDVQD